jgi:hypothetical protein
MLYQIREDSQLELCSEDSDINADNCDNIGTGDCPHEQYCINDLRIRELLKAFEGMESE